MTRRVERARRAALGLVVGMAVSVTGVSFSAPRQSLHSEDPSAPAGFRVWVEPDERRPQAGGHARIDNPLTPGSAGPPATSPAPASGPHLPDLVPLPASDVFVDNSVYTVGAADYALALAEGRDPLEGSRLALRFATTITNRGAYSLEILGRPRSTGDSGDPLEIEAQQCVRFVGPPLLGAERVCAAHEPVGTLSYHAYHGHFHIDGFAQYTLHRDAGGRPDLGPGGVLRRSEKVGFCMADTDWLQPADVEPMGWYHECRFTAPSVPGTMRQGISPGWGDTYGAGLPGQHVIVDGLPDGIYWLAITINPSEFGHIVRIRETTRANNTSFRRVRLMDGGQRAEAL